MASIKRIEGKTGISYKITVTRSRDSSGKQMRHYKTWTPEPKMTERQIEREIQRVAYEFERQLELGYAVDDRQSFEAYAEYVLDLKAHEGCKRRTIERYHELLERVIPAIGHMKLADIRPQHLNNLYKKLGEPGTSKRGDKATACADLYALMASKELKRAALATAAGVGSSTVTAACKGKKVTLTTAEAISRALDSDVNALFEVERDTSTLAPKTILEHHRLISTILSQAEKEMLVQYNAAAKSSPPKVEHRTPNYFQIKDVERIQDATEKEPLKWRTITHLLLITGCRRGEIAGLKWSKIDFENNKLLIDCALLYSSEIGIYEDTTKNRKARFVKVPEETMQLLHEYRRWYLELKLKNGDRWNDTDGCRY